jgi:hypothetical protein
MVYRHNFCAGVLHEKQDAENSDRQRRDEGIDARIV